MHKIDIHNFYQEYPFLHDMDLIRSRGLGTDKPDERYFKLLNKYKNAFSTYAGALLGLDKIDRSFRNSELGYKKVEDWDMDFYQATSANPYDFLYFRNNYYIENLERDELAYLESSSLGEDMGLVEKTISKVIDRYFGSVFDEHIVCYGPDGRNYACSSDCIVIGVRYNIDCDGDDAVERTFNQLRSADMLCSFASIALEDKIGHPVRFIRYDRFSINGVCISSGH